MAPDEGESDRGFKVVDRRSSAGEEPESPKAAQATGPPVDPDAPPAEGLPAIDFSTFVLSLGTSALFHMGLVADPDSGEATPQPNPVLARQTIDTLAMLQAKTTGNLDEQEAHLIESLLYELRMRFVEMGK